MGGHSPEAGGHDAPKEGITAEAESLSHEMLERVESKAELVMEYAEKLRSFFDKAEALFDAGSQETREKVKEAVNHLFKILKEFGVNIYESASEDFKVGILLIREQLKETIGHGNEEGHEITEQEFKEKLSRMSPEELTAFLESLDLPSISPEQEDRIERLSLMVGVLGALKDEFKRGGSTWTMWAARVFTTSELEEKTAGKFDAAADKLQGSCARKILEDPNLTLEAAAPELISFFKAPPSIAGRIMSPVNFGEDKNINQVRAEAMRALRDLSHYEEAGLIATAVLDPYFENGKHDVPDRESSRLRNTIGLELHAPARFDQLKSEAAAMGVPEEKVHEYVNDIWDAIYRVELRKLSASFIDPSKLPPELLPVWEQYNDIYDPKGEWTNVSDYNRDFIIEELCVNGALILGTAVTGVGAAALAGKLGTSTLSFMRAGRLARYLPSVARGTEALSAAGKSLSAVHRLSTEALASELFYQGAHVMGDEATLAEAIGHAPDWGKNVLWRLATLGMMGRAEKLAAGLSPALVTSFTSKISSEPMRDIAEQLFFTDHVMAATFLVVTAIKQGAYEGDPKGFVDHFGEHLYHAYGEIRGSKVTHNRLRGLGAHH